MNHNTLITKTEEFVKTKLAGEGTGHDWWHVVRVVNAAKLIQASEGGEWLTIHLALLLHDVGDRKVIRQENDDYTLAQDFLTSQDVEEERVTRIMAIIKTMSFSKSFDQTEKDDSIEFQIVQDADRLDAIGAIGVGRAFAYGGSRARLLYDPEYEATAFTSSEDYKKSEGSTIHHFYEKLFLLKENLNTATARKLAEERDAFMHTFVDQFLGEWNGNR
jgi:uncharacterized protein